MSLASADMEKYASSAYIKYEPQTYTTKVTFNTDYAELLSHGTNSQLLAVKEFREAFALSLDRNHFATAYTAAGHRRLRSAELHVCVRSLHRRCLS